MHKLYNDLAVIYAQHFLKVEDGYGIIKYNVVVSILYGLYLTFLGDGISSIESLPKEQKVKYWNIAKKYYNTEPEAIRASKAAYTLSLITSNE